MSNRTEAPAFNRYQQCILYIFRKYYSAGVHEFEFLREDIEEAAKKQGIELPKNIGDVVYSFRYRYGLPEPIPSLADEDFEWIIEGAGRARYRFKQVRLNRILPREDLLTIKIPDSTPEIISVYAQGDEQALLAKVRYNRLVDIFLGIAAYSLQNHLRTTVSGVGQIEIDEMYVGIDRNGTQFVIPVQAKGGEDKHAVVQTAQDIACCREKFPGLLCRPVSAQFMSNDRIAMFELAVVDGHVRVVMEKHYTLTLASAITQADLDLYRRITG